jgi:hypothetical protein
MLATLVGELKGEQAKPHQDTQIYEKNIAMSIFLPMQRTGTSASTYNRAKKGPIFV